MKLNKLMSVSVIIVLISNLGILADSRTSDIAKKDRESYKQDLKLVEDFFEKYKISTTRGPDSLEIFTTDKELISHLTSSLYREIVAARNQIKDMVEKSDGSTAIPFPEGGIVSGEYEAIEDWKVISIHKTSDICIIGVQFKLSGSEEVFEKEGVFTKSFFIVHHEDGISKLDDITYNDLKSGFRDILKDVNLIGAGIKP